MIRTAYVSRRHHFLAILLLLGVIFVLALAAFGSPDAQAQDKGVIKLQTSCTHNAGDSHSDAINKFIELVKQKTNGQILITNQYQALGVEQQAAQAAMTGSLDFAVMSGGNTSRFSDSMLVTDLPFIFKKYENVFKLFRDPIGARLKAQFEKDLGVKYLFVVSHGTGRDIQTSKKQIKVPADLKGVKMRTVSSHADIATFKAWGANPSPIDWGQTYTALQQGLVDGMAVGADIVLSGQWYEVVKYSLRIDYQDIFSNFFMNRKKFDSLSPAHQKAIVEAAQEAEEFGKRDGEMMLQDWIKELTEKHKHVYYYPTPAEYNQWASIREAVWKEVAEKMQGKLDMGLANEIYKAQ
jgi:tripartite ATP-independent transporter DctP family solute receptor